MAIFEARTQDDFERMLTNLGPNDTLKIWPGKWYWPRQASKEGVRIEAVDPSAAWETRIVCMRGYGLRFYDSEAHNLTFTGPGQFISLEGDNNVLNNVNTYLGDRAIGMSGNNNIVEGGYSVKSRGNGIDVNGGFMFLNGKLQNLQQGMNSLETFSPDDQEKIRNEFFRKNMNSIIRNRIGFRCGPAGGLMTGAFIKLVPGVGGFIIEGCQDFFSVGSYWYDFPGAVQNVVQDCLSVGAIVNGIFIEGSRSGQDSKAILRRNKIIGARTGLFVSSHPDVETYDNIWAAIEPKKIHGVKFDNPNRLFVNGYVRPGETDVLVAMETELYRAHTITYEPMNYDHSRDIRYHLGELPFGQANVVNSAEENIAGPYTPIDSTRIDSLSEVTTLPDIPNLDNILNEPFTESVARVYGGFDFAPVPNPGNPTEPTEPTEPGTDIEARVLALESKLPILRDRVNDHETRIARLEDVIQPTTPTVPDPTEPTEPTEPGTGLWVFDNDGNAEGQDKDNIAATYVAALIVAAVGRESTTTFMINNWQKRNSDPALVQKMKAGLSFAAKLGIAGIDYEDDRAAAVQALANIFQTGQKVTYFGGGRFFALEDALKKTPAEFHENIKVISHSRVNEGLKFDGLAVDFPLVNFVKIADQNKNFKGDGWLFLKNSTVSVFNEAYQGMETAGETSKHDPSDAGMILSELLNKEEPTISDAESLLKAAAVFQ